MDITQFIYNLPIQTFVEIGAHFGTDTERFRAMHPNARIVCFEPDPRNISILKTRGIDKIAEVYPYALSNINGKSTFYLSSGDIAPLNPAMPKILKDHDWSCSSSLKKPTGHLKDHTWITFDNKVDVDCIRLDDFATLKNSTIDFIWADVQGAEDLVFSGATETLKRTKYVYTEYSATEQYENDLNKDAILKLLGPSWEIVHDFGVDILLRNTHLTSG